MLQNKYLPVFHFAEKHSIVIHAPREKVFSLVDNLEFRQSRIIRLLFWLRGMPSSMMSLKGLSGGKFITLEIVPGEEIIIGIVGQFWRPTGELQHFNPEEFQ